MCDLGSKMMNFFACKKREKTGVYGFPIYRQTQAIRQISADFRTTDNLTAAGSQNHRQNHIEKSIHVQTV